MSIVIVGAGPHLGQPSRRFEAHPTLSGDLSCAQLL